MSFLGDALTKAPTGQEALYRLPGQAYPPPKKFSAGLDATNSSARIQKVAKQNMQPSAQFSQSNSSSSKSKEKEKSWWEVIKSPVDWAIDLVTDTAKLPKAAGSALNDVRKGNFSRASDTTGKAVGRLVEDVAKPVIVPLKWIEDETGSKVHFSDDVEIPIYEHPIGEPSPKKKPTSSGVLTSPSSLDPSEKSIQTKSPAPARDSGYTWDPNADIFGMVGDCGVKIASNFFPPSAKQAYRTYRVGGIVQGDNAVGDLMGYMANGFVKKALGPIYGVPKEVVGFYNKFYLDYLPRLEKENPQGYQDLRDCMKVSTSFHPAAKLVDMIFGPEGPIRGAMEKSSKDAEYIRENFDEICADGMNKWVNDPLISKEVAQQMAPVIQQAGIQLNESAHQKVFGEKGASYKKTPLPASSQPTAEQEEHLPSL